jgi:hypothetical protein
MGSANGQGKESCLEILVRRPRETKAQASPQQEVQRKGGPGPQALISRVPFPFKAAVGSGKEVHGAWQVPAQQRCPLLRERGTGK